LPCTFSRPPPSIADLRLSLNKLKKAAMLELLAQRLDGLKNIAGQGVNFIRRRADGP
jgi:hypothetical protein